MLNVSDEDPRVIKFGKVLAREGYSANTKRLYKWQFKKFLVDIQARKVKPANLERAAELYLRRLRMNHGRAYFLQGCSMVEISMEAIAIIGDQPRPLSKDVLRKLQSA